MCEERERTGRQHMARRMKVGGLVCLMFAAAVVSGTQSVSLAQQHHSPLISLPLVFNTWPFTQATSKAAAALTGNASDLLAALVSGCGECEADQCDGTVGFGGSPDSTGETTLDAMCMDGNSLDVGAVADLRNFKHAILVASHVLTNTQHTLLAGEQAADFAVKLGLGTKQSLTTPHSAELFESWKRNKCQPNYWKNVVPDHTTSCGPYRPAALQVESPRGSPYINEQNHDTIGMIIVGADGIVCGTSTNGANHKIAGRVGDSPIVGAGAYCDSDVGAAAATGDGDVMMRFLPSYQAVEFMRGGMDPQDAAEASLRRIMAKYDQFQGALIVADKTGAMGAACFGWNFTYAFQDAAMSSPTTRTIAPLQHVNH